MGGPKPIIFSNITFISPSHLCIHPFFSLLFLWLGVPNYCQYPSGDLAINSNKNVVMEFNKRLAPLTSPFILSFHNSYLYFIFLFFYSSYCVNGCDMSHQISFFIFWKKRRKREISNFLKITIAGNWRNVNKWQEKSSSSKLRFSFYTFTYYNELPAILLAEVGKIQQKVISKWS